MEHLSRPSFRSALPVVALVAAGMSIGASTLHADGAAIEDQYSQPILVGSAVGGSDEIPTDAAGVGADHVVRLPLDERSEATIAVEDDIVAAINFERSERGLFPYLKSENLTQVEHRWVRWMNDNYDGECPPGFGGEPNCHTSQPNWFHYEWFTPQMSGGGGMTLVGSAFLTPGQITSAWMDSPGHRVEVLGLDADLVAVGVECLPDGSTYMTAHTYERTDVPVADGPWTYEGADVEPLVPLDFGRRCPLPGPGVSALVMGDGSVVVSPDAFEASVAVRSGRLSPTGPVLGVERDSWVYRAVVRDEVGVVVGEFEWDAFRPVGDGSQVEPTDAFLISAGELLGEAASVEVAVVNAFESSQFAVAELGPAGGSGGGGEGAGTGFVSYGPERVLDTRSDAPVGLRQGGRLDGGVGRVHSFELGPVPVTAAAMVANATVVGAAGPGWVSFFPCGGPVPETANITYGTDARTAVPNQITVAVDTSSGTARVCAITPTSIDLTLDLAGWFDAGVGSVFDASAQRLIDTRELGGLDDRVVEIELPSLPDRTAVSVSIAATGADRPGWATVFDCSLGATPLAASINFVESMAVANHVTVAVEPGDEQRLCVFRSAPVHVVVDITGDWTPGTAEFEAFAEPVRVSDSRLGNGDVAVFPFQERMVISPADGVWVLNAAVVGADRTGWMALYSCGDGYDGTATATVSGGATTTNAAVVDASTGICVTGNIASHLVIDHFATFLNGDV